MLESREIKSKPPDAASDDPPPQQLQFRLKTLLTVMSLTAAVFAVATRVSFLWGAILVWIALLVAAHVVANALGTRATARAPTRRRTLVDSDETCAESLDAEHANAPTTRLGGNAALGGGTACLILAGGVVGSVVGTILIWRHNHLSLGWAGLILAALSSAVIGAFLTFLACSCVNVATRALREASRHASGSQRR